MHEVAEHPPAQPAWSLRSPVGPLTTLPILLVAFVTLLAPTDVLEQSELARTLAVAGRDFLLHVSQHADIQRFAGSTAFPQVALLGSSLHWLLLPIHALSMVALTEFNISRNGWTYWTHSRSGRSKITNRELLLALIGPLLFLAALVSATMLAGDWSLAKGLTTQSRLGMVVMFLTGFWLTALVLNGSYALLRAFVRFNLLDARPKTDA